MRFPTATAIIDGSEFPITDVYVETRVETLDDVIRDLSCSKVRVQPDGRIDDVDRRNIDARFAPFGWKCDPASDLFKSRDLRMLETECHHAKVYSGEMHPTLTPLWFWVCSRCGKDGTEHHAERPPCDVAKFWDTCAAFGRVTCEEADRMIALQTRKGGNRG